MAILHEQVMRDHVDELLLKEPQWAEVLTRVIQKMRSGGFKNVDDVVQIYGGGRNYSLVDAYIMAMIDGSVFERKIARLSIGMPMEPPADKELEALSKSLAGTMAPFDLEIWGKAGDQDGVLSWVKPVIAYLSPYEPTEPIPDGVRHPLTNLLVEPWHVPLEVGTTQSSRTWFHLLEENGVARWPYGSNHINVYIVLEPLGANPMFEGRPYTRHFNVWSQAHHYPHQIQMTCSDSYRKHRDADADAI